MDDDVKPTPVDEVIEAAGGTAILAQKLGIQAPSIYSWRRVPAGRVLAVEVITRISRHKLRPDLYPAPKRRPKRASVSVTPPPQAAE